MLSKGDLVRIRWIPRRELDRVASRRGIKRSTIDDALRKGLARVEVMRVETDIKHSNMVPLLNEWPILADWELAVTLTVHNTDCVLFLPLDCVEAVFTL